MTLIKLEEKHHRWRRSDESHFRRNGNGHHRSQWVNIWCCKLCNFTLTKPANLSTKEILGYLFVNMLQMKRIITLPPTTLRTPPYYTPHYAPDHIIYPATPRTPPYYNTRYHTTHPTILLTPLCTRSHYIPCHTMHPTTLCTLPHYTPHHTTHPPYHTAYHTTLHTILHNSTTLCSPITLCTPPHCTPHHTTLAFLLQMSFSGNFSLGSQK